MSPDEKYLAAFVLHEPKDAPPSTEAQIWDFRGNMLVRSRCIEARAQLGRYARPPRYIRYNSDGTLLIVATGNHLLHVLNAADLAEVRSIQIDSHSAIDALEVSPTSRQVAVRVGDFVRVYDLDSGQQLSSWQIDLDKSFDALALLWRTPVTTGFAWRVDGKALAVAVADSHPCVRGGGTIYILDLSTEKPVREFRVRQLPGDVAFGQRNNLYVASEMCGGYFTHWTPDLPIFDASSGREIGKIPAGKVGIRKHIAISTNKQILLAYADREKTVFELEDVLKTENEQWQVRELPGGKLIVTLPAGGLLSSSGRFVYEKGRNQVRIFSVPVLAN
jgi:WD40 repeat protein